MAKIFDELLESKRIELDFPRSFIPEEMDLYGFNPKKPAAWDISRIRHPEGEVQKTTSVRVEAFDSLAMWHIMNDSMYMIGNINRLKNKLLAKVKFEFDPSTNEYNHIVTVPSDVALDVIKDEFYNKDLHDRMYGIVTKYDKWGVLTKEKYIPSFITANEATQRAKNAR